MPEEDSWASIQSVSFVDRAGDTSSRQICSTQERPLKTRPVLAACEECLCMAYRSATTKKAPMPTHSETSQLPIFRVAPSSTILTKRRSSSYLELTTTQISVARFPSELTTS